MHFNRQDLPAAPFPLRKRSPSIAPRPQQESSDRSGDEALSPAFSILIIDRDSMSADLLANELMREKAYHATAVAAQELLSALAKSAADLIVIGAEVILQARNGLDLTLAVTRAYPNLSVVVLLSRLTRQSVINAFRSGTRGVCSRERPMAEFLECIELVRKGIIGATGNEATFLLEALKSVAAPNVTIAIDSPQLTSRQLQVVQHAAAGKTNRCIAAELHLSEHTVKNYLFRAFEKLGVSSRVELLFYLTQSGHSFGTVGTGINEGNLEAVNDLVG